MGKVSIKKKLILSFGIILISIAILGFYAMNALQNVNKKVTDITNIWMPGITTTNEISAGVFRYRLQLFNHITSTDQQEMSKHEAALQTCAAEVNSWLEKYEKSMNSSSYASEAEKQKDQQLLLDMENLWQTYQQKSQRVIEISRSNQQEKALAYVQKELAALSKELCDEKIQLVVDLNQQGGHTVAQQVQKVYRNANITLLTVCIVVIILGILVMIPILKTITKSIAELLRVSQEVAKGNLQVEVQITSQDEFGLLGESYNTMIENLKNLIVKINQTAQQVAASSEELTATSDQVAMVSNSIAESTTDLAAGAEKQTQSVSAASGVIEQMTANIQQVAVNSNTVYESTNQANAKAKDGEQSIVQVVQQMEKIEATVNNSAKVVSDLGERSKEIGQIVDAISGIASQTNLLALNAAIEAARAGEQGKGFAVVAEEVRKLAEESSKAAEQISALIKEIQSNTDKAVHAMAEGTEEVQVGSHVVDIAGKAFQEIAVLVEVVSNQIKDISSSAQEMSEDSNQIINSVHEVNALTKKATEATENVSAATEEQSASIQEVAASSQSLAKMAEELQIEINKFKL